MALIMNESKDVNYAVLKAMLSASDFLLLIHVLSQPGMGLRSESLEEIPDMTQRLTVERLVDMGLMSLNPAREPTADKSHILRITLAAADPVLRYAFEIRRAVMNIDIQTPQLL